MLNNKPAADPSGTSGRSSSQFYAEHLSYVRSPLLMSYLCPHQRDKNCYGCQMRIAHIIVATLSWVLINLFF